MKRIDSVSVVETDFFVLVNCHRLTSQERRAKQRKLGRLEEENGSSLSTIFIVCLEMNTIIIVSCSCEADRKPLQGATVTTRHISLHISKGNVRSSKNRKCSWISIDSAREKLWLLITQHKLILKSSNRRKAGKVHRRNTRFSFVWVRVCSIVRTLWTWKFHKCNSKTAHRKSISLSCGQLWDG